MALLAHRDSSLKVLTVVRLNLNSFAADFKCYFQIATEVLGGPCLCNVKH